MKRGERPTIRIMTVLIATLLTVIYVGMPFEDVQAQQNGNTTAEQTGSSSLVGANLTAGDFDLIQENFNDAREAIHGNDTVTAIAELETAQDEILRLSNETGTATAVQTTAEQTVSSSSVEGNLTAGDFDLVQESLNDAREAIHGNDTASAIAELETAHDEILSLSNETGD
jgi:5-bromo-4-chloroindolyl phosphate hydrolysis protein